MIFRIIHSHGHGSEWCVIQEYDAENPEASKLSVSEHLPHK